MDMIDQQLLALLSENARVSISELGQKVHLSAPAVSERIRKLEIRGIIQQYTVKMNRELLGKHLLAFIFVTLEHRAHIATFRESIVQLPHVIECHHLAGEADYLLKVAVAHPRELEQFLSDELRQIPGVYRSQTQIVLSTLKETVNGG
ncbi:MAG: Lrp/AsnC family transcriptional regulator [Culicoidibacterales bacterium]